MIKKIDIAGLQLDNYTVREMLMRVDRRISEKILTTIEEVNMDTLTLAESDEEVKQSLEACDYTVIADEGILRAASAYRRTAAFITCGWSLRVFLPVTSCFRRDNERNGSTITLPMSLSRRRNN